MKSGSLIRGIFGRPSGARHDYVVSPGLFMELDLERMKKRLNIKREAAYWGEQEIPPTTAKTFDDVEQRIVTAIEGEIKQSHQQYADHLKTYGDRIQSLDFQTKFTQIVAAADTAASDFKACVSQGTDLLFQQKRDIVLVEDEIEAFRKKHGLRRTAHIPRSKILLFGIVLLLLCVEALLNGNMLATGHELGLFGGVGEALLIAALNVWFLGVILGGASLRLSHHKNIAQKALGVSGLLSFAVLVLIFNLSVAHYRDALGGDNPEQAAYAALQSLYSTPLGIEDLRSWMLFMVGCMFSCAGAADGLKMDDPYPGYGKLARRQIEIQDEYVEQKQELMADLQDIRDQAIEKMETAASDIAHRRSEYRAIIEAKGKLAGVFKQHLIYLQQCANELLTSYRMTNRQARKTEPPIHFSQPWETSLPMSPEFEPTGDAGQLELEREIGLTFDELSQKRRKVHSGFDAAVLEYRRIEELTPEALNNDS